MHKGIIFGDRIYIAMTTLIKNVILVDGSGRPPFKADVIIRDEKILAMGSFPNYKADAVIYGNEGYLVPGFIDVNSGSDRYLTLLSSPIHQDFLLQGITTTLMGHCGFSLAPNLYGQLEHFFHWAKTNAFNVNWRSVGEFLTALDARGGLGVNIATLVGHKVIREDILKDPSEFRKLTANELRVFRLVLDRSMEQGAFGMSSGLGTYPYSETPYHELRALLSAVKDHNGLYTTHLRNEREKTEASVEETIKLAQETSVPTIISHFRPFLGFEEEYRRARSLIEERVARADVYFDVNPFGASAVSLDTFVPESLREEEEGVVVQKLKDAKTSKEIQNMFPRVNSKKIIILHAPDMEFLNGKTLYEFAEHRQLSHRAALLKLMEITKLRGVVFYENLSSDDIIDSMFSARALISTNSPSFDDALVAFKPDRAIKTFPTYLHIADSKGVSIEKAIAKITGLPSHILNLDGRGFISDGYFADMTLLGKDLDVQMVMVNGAIAVQQGALIKGFSGSGKTLRKV